MAMQRQALLMARLIERGAQVQPDAEIVTATEDGTRRQSLSETRDRAHRLAHALAASGVRPGDRVATFMWNGARHLEVYHAAAGMGAVLHTLNPRLGPADLEYIVRHARDRIVIADADALPLLAPLAGRVPSVRAVVVAVEPGCEGWETDLAPAVDYEAFIDGHPTRFDWPDLAETAPLGLCYTSGTTGRPKGVEYEHRSQYLHTLTQCLPDVLGLSGADAVLGIVPMFHVMGWGIPWAALMLGCKQVMPHRFMAPERLLALMAEEGVTFSAGVPTVWQGVKAAVEAAPGTHDLSALTRVVCGGSAAPPALVAWFHDALGVEMIHGWGMTETSPLATMSRRRTKRAHLRLPVAEQLANVAKAGPVLPGLELDVFDSDFKRLPHDGRSVGEVLVRGPWVCSDYFDDPQPGRFHQDWLVTGDVGSIDADEYLVIADRSKDLVKSGGEWISSVDMENHIVALDGVAQACVVAQPHPKWDERPIALVVLEAGAAVDAAAIREHCAGRFAKWQLPDDILFTASIPLTGTGKLDKKQVRQNLAAANYQLPDLRAGESATN